MEGAEEGNRLVKWVHVSTGSTPSKEKKRAKRSHSTAIRKTLFQRSESSNEPSPNRKVSTYSDASPFLASLQF